MSDRDDLAVQQWDNQQEQMRRLLLSRGVTKYRMGVLEAPPSGQAVSPVMDCGLIDGPMEGVQVTLSGSAGVRVVEVFGGDGVLGWYRFTGDALLWEPNDGTYPAPIPPPRMQWANVFGDVGE